MFTVIQRPIGPMDNFLYLIHDHASGKVAAVDPAWDVETYIGEAEDVDGEITDILITHTHSDHVNALAELHQRTGAAVHISMAEANAWRPTPDDAVRHDDGDVIQLGETPITVIMTPGHTVGGCSYSMDGHLIVGDTMFVYGCGHCRMLGGDSRQLYRSLHRLLDELPGDTVIYPGHNYGITPTSTLAEQAAGNPYLLQPDEDSFVEFRDNQPSRQTPYGPVSQ
jgi:glyoxylase-like metal-dependent hydrolase (beta-lactamase superfamily II)